MLTEDLGDRHRGPTQQSRLELGAASQRLILSGRMIWIAVALRDDGKRFVVHQEEKLTARMPASTSSPDSVPVGAPFTWAATAPWAHPTPPQIPLGRLCSRPPPLGR
jgi:hypothetical protein